MRAKIGIVVVTIRIHWAGEAEPDGEAALIAYESEDSSADEEELIPLRYALPWGKE